MDSILMLPQASIDVPDLGLGDIDSIPMSELYVPFEGLGNNCEFGIVQRKNGYDAPGLFRNVGFLSAKTIISVIESGLAGMFDDRNYDFLVPDGWPDWRLHCKISGMGFHTAIPSSLAAGSAEWTTQTEQSILMFRFLKRNFLEDLRVGEKIFVFRHNLDSSNETIERLHDAIRKYGDNWLLYIVQDPERPSGWIEMRKHGLLVAGISRLSNENPPVIDFEAWKKIARKSLTLKWQNSRNTNKTVAQTEVLSVDHSPSPSHLNLEVATHLVAAKMTIKKPMRHVISLGRNCDVAFQLRMHGVENIPHFFDWLGTPAAALTKIFDADFDVFHTDDLTLMTDHPSHYVMDRATGVVFFHQFPFVDGHTTRDFRLFYAHFIKSFKFQARRFKEYVKTLPVTLVRRDIAHAEAIALEESFFRRFPEADARFLYLVHDNDEFHTDHGHARHLPRTRASLGDPTVWVKLLIEEGLIGKPYGHATAEILGASHDDHNLSPENRFSEQELISAIEGNPEHFMFPLELATYYRKRNQFDAAEAAALRALGLSPDSPEVMFELIQIRWKSHKISASEASDALIKLTKKSQLGGLLHAAAACLLEADRLKEATEYSAKALSQNPLDHNAYYTRAMSLYRNKNVTAAERAISAAISLNTKSPLYFHMQARFLDELGNFEAAVASERKALEVGGGFQSLVHVGQLMKKLGRHQDALDIWRQALPMTTEHKATVQGWIDSLQSISVA
jgi:tetratricopeptide (TPR) repeat protein